MWIRTEAISLCSFSRIGFDEINPAYLMSWDWEYRRGMIPQVSPCSTREANQIADARKFYRPPVILGVCIATKLTEPLRSLLFLSPAALNPDGLIKCD